MLHCQKAEEMKNNVSFPSSFSKFFTCVRIYYTNSSWYVFTIFSILQQLYTAEYEDIKTRSFFPQTITPEYEVSKKLQDCKDVSGAGSQNTLMLLLVSIVCASIQFFWHLVCRKNTVNIQTQWNLHKWWIRQFWFKPASTPNNWVTYVSLQEPLLPTTDTVDIRI